MISFRASLSHSQPAPRLSTQKLGAGAAIFACLAVCGCVASPEEARQKYEQATADYNACLVANQNGLAGCEEKKKIMETALSDNNDAICRSYGLAVGSSPYAQCRENLGR
jgi:outer membrane murein-binding lipoprotein Lpp